MSVLNKVNNIGRILTLKITLVLIVLSISCSYYNIQEHHYSTKILKYNGNNWTLDFDPYISTYTANTTICKNPFRVCLGVENKMLQKVNSIDIVSFVIIDKDKNDTVYIAKNKTLELSMVPDTLLTHVEKIYGYGCCFNDIQLPYNNLNVIVKYNDEKEVAKIEFIVKYCYKNYWKSYLFTRLFEG